MWVPYVVESLRYGVCPQRARATSSRSNAEMPDFACAADEWPGTRLFLHIAKNRPEGRLLAQAEGKRLGLGPGTGPKELPVPGGYGLVEGVLDLAAVVLALAGDRDALHAGSAFLKPHGAAVAIQTLGGAVGAILEVAVAAEDLKHLVGH